MKDPITQVMRRVKGYWYVDGTYEFNLGLDNILMAVFFFLQTPLIASANANLLLLIFGYLLIGGVGWLTDRLIRALKTSVTFPRSGYISLRNKKREPYPPDILILLAFFVVFIAAIVFDWLDRFFPTRWIPIWPGVVQAVATGVTAFRTAQKRFYLLAAVSLLLGLTLVWVGKEGWDPMVAGWLYFGPMSLVFLVMGAFTLWNYLHTNPPPAEPSDEP
jgi:hypothetical protein